MDELPEPDQAAFDALTNEFDLILIAGADPDRGRYRCTQAAADFAHSLGVELPSNVTVLKGGVAP